LVEREVSICVNLSAANRHAVEALCVIEKIDRSKLLKELVEDGLLYKVISLYEASKLSSGKAAEILGVSLREFMEILEKRLVPFNWDSDSIKEYLKQIP
jgi:predicted HTH domain antitoxin